MSPALALHPGEPAVSAGATAPAPRGRPSWSGLLRLSLVAVPVKAYPAVRTSAATPFHQLHAGCGQRLRYEKRCPQHGPVEADAIVRGYAYAPDQHVVVEPEELDQLRPARDKALVLEHFLPAHQVEPTAFAGRSLYLLPEGPAARHPYGVLAQALRQSGTWALGRVVLAGHRLLVLVRPAGRLLALDVLHYPAQVRAAETLETDLGDGPATPEELGLARRLIEAATGPADWSRYRDTSAEELAALVQAKVAHRPPPATADEPVAVLQLLDALKRSVAAAAAAAGPASAPSRKPRGPRRARP